MLASTAEAAVGIEARACSSRFAKVTIRHCKKHALMKDLTAAVGVVIARTAQRDDSRPASTGKRKLLSSLAPTGLTYVKEWLIPGAMGLSTRPDGHLPIGFIF